MSIENYGYYSKKDKESIISDSESIVLHPWKYKSPELDEDGVAFSNFKRTIVRADQGWFNKKEYTVPEGVTKIEKEAFKGQRFLESINLPKSLKHIGESGFSGCSDLKEIIIPENVKKIGEKAFENCESLEKVILSKNIKEIADSTFYSCTNLKEVIIPEGVVKIGDKAFFNCRDLEKITLPSTLKEIGENAFGCCTSLKEITIPEGVKKIEREAFSICTSLEKVTLPSTLKEMPENIFLNSDNIKEVIIPLHLENWARQEFKDKFDEIVTVNATEQEINKAIKTIKANITSNAEDIVQNVSESLQKNESVKEGVINHLIETNHFTEKEIQELHNSENFYDAVKISLLYDENQSSLENSEMNHEEDFSHDLS